MKNDFFATALGRFRLVAISEGISYLLLLGIAMPLKYAAGIEEAVKYMGWLHGLLFILFGLTLIQVWIQNNWKFSKAVIAFAWSFVPFGTFIFDRQLKKEALLEA